MTSVLTQTRTVRYRFASLPLAFESTDGTWLGQLETRYGAFRGEPTGRAFSIRFEPSAPLPEQLVSPFQVHHESPSITMTSSGFRLTTPTTSADVDLSFRQARLDGPCAMYPLDNLLRHLLPLLWERGALFHGAALAKGDRGIVACGPSGAGKSTLARLAGRLALSDELCAVGRNAHSFRLESLPFWNARPGSATLEAMLVLEHGSEHRLRPLSRGDGFRALSKQTLWPIDFPHAIERILDALSGLVETVPVFELAFAPRDDVGRFIEEKLL